MVAYCMSPLPSNGTPMAGDLVIPSTGTRVSSEIYFRNIFMEQKYVESQNFAFFDPQADQIAGRLIQRQNFWCVGPA